MNMMGYFRFFQDLWRLFKEFANPVSADRYWQQLSDRAEELVHKYGDSEFARQMAGAVVWEIDRAYQKRENNANN